MEPWDQAIQANAPWVRASSMPRFFECASSEMPIETPVEYLTQAADTGTAGHKAIETVANGGVPNLAQLAEDYGANLKDLADAHQNAIAIWHKLRAYFPDGTVAEATIRGKRTGGTVDLAFMDGVTMAFNDWKFGSIKRNHRPQILSYADAAVEMHGFPESGQIDAWVAYPAIDGEPEHWAIFPDDLDAFRERFYAQVSRMGKQYAPGDACTFCRHQLRCEARADWVRNCASVMIDADGRDLTAEDLGLLYPQAKVLEKALERYSKALRLMLEKEDSLLTGDGKKLILIEIAKESLDPVKAGPVLKQFGFSDDEFNAALTLSKTKIVKTLRDRAQRGNKQAEEDQVMAALEEAGAVMRFRYKKIQPRKA